MGAAPPFSQPSAAHPIAADPQWATYQPPQMGAPLMPGAATPYYAASAFPSRSPIAVHAAPSPAPLALKSLAATHWSTATAYGRGSRSLAYSQRKAAALLSAVVLVVVGIASLGLVCLYEGACAAGLHGVAAGGHVVYSTASSDAVVPIALVLILVVAPLCVCGASLGRLGVTLLGAGTSALTAALLLAAGLQQLALLPTASDRAGEVW